MRQNGHLQVVSPNCYDGKVRNFVYTSTSRHWQLSIPRSHWMSDWVLSEPLCSLMFSWKNLPQPKRPVWRRFHLFLCFVQPLMFFVSWYGVNVTVQSRHLPFNNWISSLWTCLDSSSLASSSYQCHCALTSVFVASGLQLHPGWHLVWKNYTSWRSRVFVSEMFQLTCQTPGGNS